MVADDPINLRQVVPDWSDKKKAATGKYSQQNDQFSPVTTDADHVDLAKKITKKNEPKYIKLFLFVL